MIQLVYKRAAEGTGDSDREKSFHDINWGTKGRPIVNQRLHDAGSGRGQVSEHRLRQAHAPDAGTGTKTCHLVPHATTQCRLHSHRPLIEFLYCHFPNRLPTISFFFTRWRWKRVKLRTTEAKCQMQVSCSSPSPLSPKTYSLESSVLHPRLIWVLLSFSLSQVSPYWRPFQASWTTLSRFRRVRHLRTAGHYTISQATELNHKLTC